ncbi:MAG: insulinase family protein, partial [Bacteroidetes bacterium]|nr:insulinase family protein [Bacteroidota bacterium]
MKTKKIFMSILACLAFTALIAQPQLIEKVEAKPDKVVIAYEKWKLSNGLIVLLHEDHSDPVVNVMVTYKVGSNRESIGRSGFAHFFEHMMFRGTEKYSKEKYSEMMKSIGASANANTSLDRTVYHMTGNANKLETMFELESDRFQNLKYSIQDFKTEAGAV